MMDDFPTYSGYQNPYQEEQSGCSQSTGHNKFPFKYDKHMPYADIRPTFDYYLVCDLFEPVNSTSEIDNIIDDVIQKKLTELTPHSEEISGLSNTISNVYIVLEKLKSLPANIDACRIEDICQVGSLRMGTIIKGHRVGDIVVVLRTLPVKAAISALGNKILEELQRIEPTTPYQINFREDYLQLTNMFNRDAIRILIATNAANLKKLNNDIHVKKKFVFKNLLAIQHAKWFENNGRSNEVKKLIMVFKDICMRFKEFSFLTPWMIIILCHYSMTRTKTCQDLPICIALKRIFQLLSSGFFLPYSAGILDPVQPKMPIHGKLSVSNQEAITRCAQSLLRVINYHNGYKYLFGMETLGVNITDSVTYWSDLVFTPCVSVFDNDDLTSITTTKSSSIIPKVEQSTSSISQLPPSSSAQQQKPQPKASTSTVSSFPPGVVMPFGCSSSCRNFDPSRASTSQIANPGTSGTSTFPSHPHHNHHQQRRKSFTNKRSRR